MIIYKEIMNNCNKLLTVVKLNNSFRNYAFKSDLKIKWVRPEKISFFKQAKTGDLNSFPKNIDKTQPLLMFRESKELETANELVKKLFSLEFAPQRLTNQVYRNEVIEKVKRHEMDTASAEVKIAKWTAIIHAQQQAMDRFPKNKRMKVALKELIDKRKKQMKYLRRWDYKRFEWLLEALNIVYKPPPSEFRWVARKESLVKLTNKYCEETKQKKLDEYRKLLEDQQPAFLQEKLRLLEFVRDEQKECGAKVTIKQEEIDEVKKELDDLLEKRKKVESVD